MPPHPPHDSPGPTGGGLFDEQGSALVLVLLVLLSLSALGMVGMRNITRSMHLAGAYRARTAADMYADSVGQFMAHQFGNRARQMWGTMKRSREFERRERQSNDNTSLSRRDQEMRQGATMRLLYDPSTGTNDFASLFKNPPATSNSESGLFTWGSDDIQSFESTARSTEFEVVIRNPVDMPTPSGYSDQYCFKKVTIAARAELGDPESDWSTPRTVGVGQTLFETMVGPIRCQSN